MRIRDALPGIFHKAYPVLDPNAQVLPVMSLLRFHEIDALPVYSEDARLGKTVRRAVYGFYSLRRLMALKPGEFSRFLTQPCGATSERLSTISAGRSLTSLLGVFAKTRFGFARVEDGANVGALAGLRDVLPLYEAGAVETGLSVEDVGSPIVSVERDATLREALETMFAKRHRRVFVSGKKQGFISDREIIAKVFSPGVLSDMAQGDGDVLGIRVSDIEETTAAPVEKGTSVKAAARLLREEVAGQCLVSKGMVVTPWDVVMKPWISGELRIASS